MNDPIIYAICILGTIFLSALIYIFRVTKVGPVISRGLVVFVEHGEKHGYHYLVGICLILGACFTAFYDNFMPLDVKTCREYGWWQVLALLSKSMGAAPSALLAYLMRSPLTPKTEVNKLTIEPAKPTAPVETVKIETPIVP